MSSSKAGRSSEANNTATAGTAGVHSAGTVASTIASSVASSSARLDIASRSDLRVGESATCDTRNQNGEGPNRQPEAQQQQQKQQEQQRQQEQQQRRIPLGALVGECVKRWFKQTAEEAENGVPAMQTLLGQMYISGYGTKVDVAKGKAWLKKASEKDPQARMMLRAMNGKQPDGPVIFDGDL